MAQARRHAGPAQCIAVWATVLVSPLRRESPDCHASPIRCVAQPRTEPALAGAREFEVGILLDACLCHLCPVRHEPPVLAAGIGVGIALGNRWILVGFQDTS